MYHAVAPTIKRLASSHPVRAHAFFEMMRPERAKYGECATILYNAEGLGVGLEERLHMAETHTMYCHYRAQVIHMLKMNPEKYEKDCQLAREIIDRWSSDYVSRAAQGAGNNSNRSGTVGDGGGDGAIHGSDDGRMSGVDDIYRELPMGHPVRLFARRVKYEPLETMVDMLDDLESKFALDMEMRMYGMEVFAYAYVGRRLYMTLKIPASDRLARIQRKWVQECFRAHAEAAEAKQAADTM